MARVKRSVNSKKGRRKILAAAKGYNGSRSRHLRAANEQVMHSGKYAFRDRRARKGDMRKLWIVRINAACREHDLSYSRFIAGLPRGRGRRRPQDARRPCSARPAGVRAARRIGPRSADRSLTGPALGARHRELTRLRVLARDRSARDAAALVVIDGPRAVDGVLARGATIEAVYVDGTARGAAARVAGHARERGVTVREVVPGALARAGEVRTNAGVIALARRPPVPGRDTLARGACWLVCTEIGDPGNLGALVRSAEAAGAAGIVVGRGSADVYNPKSVHTSAGAVFGITVLEDDIVTVLSDLATRGVRRVGAVAHGGVAPWDCAFGPRLALVLGHETRGIEGLDVDERVSIPMAGAAESLNVAAAATVLLFEVARRAGVAS